ncbi:MAG: hypothetical protein IAF08_16615 [Rhizobacter sp.]|nr:hypothetical protein [Chlorobiales bacterium]
MVACLALSGAELRADEKSRFAEANKFYNDGNYAAAIEKYRALDSAGYQSGELYYNMGNTYYKLSQTGNAVLYYEKAARLLQGDEDVKANLELAQLKTKDKIAEVPKFFLSKITEDFFAVFSQTFLGILTLIFFYALAAVALLRLRNLLPSSLAGVLQIVLLVLFIISAAIFGAKSYREASRAEAVVLTPTVNAKNEPRDAGQTLFIIHEGLKVDLTRTQSEQGDVWIEIRLPDGNKGWIRRTDVGLI